MSTPVEFKPFNDLETPLDGEQLIESLNFIATLLVYIKATSEGQEFRMKISDIVPEWPLDEAFHTIMRFQSELVRTFRSR